LDNANTEATTGNPTTPSTIDEELEPSTNSRETAIAHLINCDFITPGEPIDIHILAHILLQLCAIYNMGKPATDGVRAVAHTLRGLADDNFVQDVVQQVKEKIDGITDHLSTRTNDLQVLINRTTNTANAITNNTPNLYIVMRTAKDHLPEFR
jgi:hypothetical protein